MANCVVFELHLASNEQNVEQITLPAVKETKKKFIKPTIEDVRAHCTEKGYSFDPEAFYAFYESNGWKVGKNPMKDWKAAVRTWERGESKAKSRNTLLNYNETQTEVKPIELNLEEL